MKEHRSDNIKPNIQKPFTKVKAEPAQKPNGLLNIRCSATPESESECL